MRVLRPEKVTGMKCPKCSEVSNFTVSEKLGQRPVYAKNETELVVAKEAKCAKCAARFDGTRSDFLEFAGIAKCMQKSRKAVRTDLYDEIFGMVGPNFRKVPLGGHCRDTSSSRGR